MSDRPNRPPPPRPLADTSEPAIDDTVCDRTLIVDTDPTVSDRTVPDRTVPDRTVPDRTVPDRPVAAVDTDDTVADRTEILDTERTAVSQTPTRPTPMADQDDETLVSPHADEAHTLEELRRVGRELAQLLAELGRWFERRVLRPSVRGVARGLTQLTDLFRARRPEDSDAYSRRRGQEWRRFREGDPSINELREFDSRHRGKRNEK